MKRRNKLYTLSYFRKRLKESGFFARILVEKYEESDKRYWTICIGELDKIICTCFKYNEDGESTVKFHFTDGNQRLAMDKYIQTESMNVIIEMLERVINT
jgi:hypothetical protein